MPYFSGIAAADEVSLKCGAVVMALRNMSETVKNGSKGKLVGFRIYATAVGLSGLMKALTLTESQALAPSVGQ
jgi:hypothetical protein